MAEEGSAGVILQTAFFQPRSSTWFSPNYTDTNLSTVELNRQQITLAPQYPWCRACRMVMIAHLCCHGEECILFGIQHICNFVEGLVQI